VPVKSERRRWSNPDRPLPDTGDPSWSARRRGPGSWAGAPRWTRTRVAARVPGDPAGLARGGHRRLRVRHHRLHRAPEPGRRSGSGSPPRPTPDAWPPAHARLRPESHGAGPPVGGGPSRVLRGGDGGGTSRAAKLHLRQAEAGPPDLAYGRDPHFPGWPDTCSSTTATRPRRKRCWRSC